MIFYKESKRYPLTQRIVPLLIRLAILLGCDAEPLVELFIEMRTVVEARPVDDFLNGERSGFKQLGGIADAAVFDKVLWRHLVEFLESAIQVANAYLHVIGHVLRGDICIVHILVDKAHNRLHKVFVLALQ